MSHEVDAKENDRELATVEEPMYDRQRNFSRDSHWKNKSSAGKHRKRGRKTMTEGNRKPKRAVRCGDKGEIHKIVADSKTNRDTVRDPSMKG